MDRGFAPTKQTGVGKYSGGDYAQQVVNEARLHADQGDAIDDKVYRGNRQFETPDAHFAWTGQYLYDRRPETKPALYGGHGPGTSTAAIQPIGQADPTVANLLGGKVQLR